MYCIACGKHLSNGAKFCGRCGTRVPDIDQETRDRIAEMEGTAPWAAVGTAPKAASGLGGNAVPTVPSLRFPDVQIPTDQISKLGREAYGAARAGVDKVSAQAKEGFADALDKDAFDPKHKMLFGVGHVVAAATIFLPWVQYGGLRTMSAIDYDMVLFNYFTQTLGEGRSLFYLVFAVLTGVAIAIVAVGNLYGAYRQLVQEKGSRTLFVASAGACPAFLILLVVFGAINSSMAHDAGQVVASLPPSWGAFAALAISVVLAALASGRIDLDHLINETRK